jgi:hypothetical protein
MKEKFSIKNGEKVEKAFHTHTNIQIAKSIYSYLAKVVIRKSKPQIEPVLVCVEGR